ncbi:hypothetical protein QBK99_00080 [Corticibacterium sp. UT-5YL-CI-8]|nr:hypothetical protein [Tianweitania sp. UT-5YL-CI-8]
MAITREEIVAVLGPIDDELVAELMGAGASADEIRDAWGWLNSDEALMGAVRPLPGPASPRCHPAGQAWRPALSELR